MVNTIFLFIVRMYSSAVFGQDSLSGQFDSMTGHEPVGSGEYAFQRFMQSVYDFAFPFGVFCCVILMSYATVRMILSSGDPEQLKEAREIMTNALMGVLMIGLGLGILYIIANVLGVELDSYGGGGGGGGDFR